MAGALDITVRHERGVVIAAVSGDIDISTVSGLRERLSKLAETGRTLIVDLNRVTFIDSAGLGALVGAYRQAAARGGSLHAVCSRPQIRRLLWLTGVDRRIPLAATVDGALMFLAASRAGAGRQRIAAAGGQGDGDDLGQVPELSDRYHHGARRRGPRPPG
ncbi:MAG TPA: STAS domain-containing protein [Streptosporangiaceae bacterium]